MQRDFFRSDRDQEIRDLIDRRDSINAELTAVKSRLAQAITNARALPVTPDGSVFLGGLDDNETLIFYSFDRKQSLKVSRAMLIESLQKLGALL